MKAAYFFQRLIITVLFVLAKVAFSLPFSTEVSHRLSYESETDTLVSNKVAAFFSGRFFLYPPLKQLGEVRIDFDIFRDFKEKERNAPLLGHEGFSRLSEAHITWGFSQVQVVAGLQSLSWCENWGLDFIDVVAPRNYRSYFFDSAKQTKLSLWALNFLGTFSTVNAQFLLIPLATDTVLPERWNGFRVIPLHSKKYFADGEFGVRVGSLLDFGLDLKIGYLNHLNRNPAFTVTWDHLVPVLHQKLSRVSSLLVSGSYATESLVFRGDVVYSSQVPYNKNFTLTLFESNDLTFVAGVDYTSPEQLTLGVQYGGIRREQSLFSENPQYRDSIALLASKNWWHNRFETQFNSWFSLRSQDRWLSAKMGLSIASLLTYSLRYDHIVGTTEGELQSFDANDRVISEIQYHL